MSKCETTGLLVNSPARLESTSGWRSRDALTKSLKGAGEKIWQAYVRYRSLRADDQRISKLSDHLLADVGITRQEAKELDRRKVKKLGCEEGGPRG